MMKNRLPQWERYLCYALVPLALALSVIGIYSSVLELVNEVKQR
jgi:hypothetical protein